MARFLYHDFHRTYCRIKWLPLAFLGGILSGVYLFQRADGYFSLMMCRALSCRVSIVSLAAAYLLPFLFSAFAVYFHQTWLFGIVAYCKALSFSCVALGIGAAFGDGAWLACILLLFCDICTIPFLWFYWIRPLRAPGSFEGYSFWMMLIMLAGLDYFVIAPFAAAL